MEIIVGVDVIRITNLHTNVCIRNDCKVDSRVRRYLFLYPLVGYGGFKTVNNKTNNATKLYTMDKNTEREVY